MKQALHIFRKDLRRLWLPVLISLAGVALFVREETQSVDGAIHAGALFPMLLSACWLYLIARLVHEESLPGDTQFWLSRPYSRFSLGAAKLCFVAVFVVVPFLIAGIVILQSLGFDTLPRIPGLLIKLFYLAALLWLPAFALAAITRRLSYFTIGTFLVLGALVGASQLYGRVGRIVPGQVSWISEGIAELILFLGAATVSLWQFRTRRTHTGLALFAGCLLLATSGFFISSDVAFAVNAAVQPEPLPFHSVVLSVSRDGNVEPPLKSGETWVRESYTLSLPYRLTGVPENTDVNPEAVTVRISAGDGSSLSLFERPSAYSVGGLAFRLSQEEFDRLRNRPVRLAGTLWLTLFQPQTPQRSAHGRPVTLPGVGRCDSAHDRVGAWIRCTMPLRTRHRVAISLVARDTGERFHHQTIAYPPTLSPLPDFGFSPVNRAVTFFPASFGQGRFYGGPVALTHRQIEQMDVKYEVATPVAHLRRDFVLENVVLSKLPSAPESR
ncbi:MAG: hypothetical protein ACKV22_19175 [Bryobacteraceae bacterium]